MNKAARIEHAVVPSRSPDVNRPSVASEAVARSKPQTFRWAAGLGLATAASILLLVSLRLPLWQMRLEAPQYRDQEALRVAVHPNALRGDLRELSVLDRYIGVHIPATLPQFRWLPGVLAAGASLGFLAGFLHGAIRTGALTLVSCALAVALTLAAGQALSQMHDIGHKRDQKTVLAGVHDFTPPFLGTRKIAQFTVSSQFGLGAWLIGGALVLQVGAAWLSSTRRFNGPMVQRFNHSTIQEFK